MKEGNFIIYFLSFFLYKIEYPTFFIFATHLKHKQLHFYYQPLTPLKNYESPILLTICLCTVLWFISCSDEKNDSPSTPQFSIEEQYLQQDFEQSATSVVIPVKTNLETSQWSVKSDQSWCLVDQEHTSSQASGILISIQASEEPDIRTATITVNSSVENYNIQVRQLGYGPAILLKQEAKIYLQKEVH